MTTTTLTLADFLLARYREDAHELFRQSLDLTAADTLRARNDLEAKRRIVGAAIPSGWTDEGEPLGSGYVEMWWDALRFLALPYADHPDYRDEWRP